MSNDTYTPEEEAAIKAAEAWLALVDAGDYAKSWEEAASFFKGVVDQAKWEQTIAGTRPPFGDVLSREVDSATYATELPGAPDGEYVVLTFATSFAQKKNSIETITPMRDGDRGWRVSGYFIK